MKTIRIGGYKVKVPTVTVNYAKYAGADAITVTVIKKVKPKLKIKEILVPLRHTGIGIFADNAREVTSKPFAKKLKTKPYYGLDSTTADNVSDMKKAVKLGIEWLEQPKQRWK